MSTPRIAAIHDLSCFGRCSLTIALPVLSAIGCQCCPLPTALLSAHTGFSGNTFLDLTAEMGRIAEHWAAMDLQFDAIYSGFLGSAASVRLGVITSEFSASTRIPRHSSGVQVR